MLMLEFFDFTSRLIAISFYISSYILNIINRRNKLTIKNLDKKTLYNLESKTKSLYIKLHLATKIQFIKSAL